MSRDTIDAQYRDGVLELSLTKVGEPKKKVTSIEIK